MRNSLVLGTLSTAAAIASLTVVSSFSPAEAASFSFDTNNFTGSDAKVTITLDDQAAGAGKIQFSVKMAADSPAIGDLRGIFFNIANDALLSGLQFSGTDITSTVKSAGSVTSVGSANLNGNGNTHVFDIGVEIGENGLKGGKDDFQTTTFVLSHASQALNLSLFSQQDFGIRMTSVGTGNKREGSSKLVGTSPLPPVSVTPAPTPTPSTSTPAPAPAPTPAPVVIAPPPTASPVPVTPAQPTKPTEIPEPGTTTALLLASIGTFKFLKRKNKAQA